MQEKYFKVFSLQKAGALGNEIENEPSKLRPKLKNYVYYIFTENICSAYNSMQVVDFYKNVLIL